MRMIVEGTKTTTGCPSRSLRILIMINYHPTPALTTSTTRAEQVSSTTMTILSISRTSASAWRASRRSSTNQLRPCAQSSVSPTPVPSSCCTRTSGAQTRSSPSTHPPLLPLQHQGPHTPPPSSNSTAQCVHSIFLKHSSPPPKVANTASALNAGRCTARRRYLLECPPPSLAWHLAARCSVGKILSSLR